MQFTTTFMNFFFAVAGVMAIFSGVGASPRPLNAQKRDVFTPPVTYPISGVHWSTGQTQNVTWDTSNHPVNITNKVGMIFLRKDNYTTPLYLANEFDILPGSIEVMVPWVVPGDNYQLVLFGDPGNFSPYFSINQ